MQKKLLALAIAGAMAAPLAAQAQGSNVTIYGTLRPSVDAIDNGDESGASMNHNGSLIGFRGTEDLGNGLKAIFQIESKAKINEQGSDDSLFGSRDSWVGLSGGFGSLTVGNHTVAYKYVTDFADPFAFTIGDYNNILATNSRGDGNDLYNDRYTNSVYYTSPSFSGFQIVGSYALRDALDGDDFQDDRSDEIWSVAATYTWGPLNFALAYADAGKSYNDVALTTSDDRKAWKAAVGYKFGSTTLAAVYANEEFSANGDDGFEGDLGDRDVWFVSVKHNMGKIDLMASYTNAGDLDEVDDSGADAIAIGAVYSFSKRTNIGAYYAKVSNDDNAAYGMDSGYDPSGDGENISGFSVRMSHSF